MLGTPIVGLTRQERLLLFDVISSIDLELKLGGTTISVGGLATIIPTVNNKCFHLLQSCESMGS